MLKKKIQDMLNNQINAEFYAAHLYLSMSAYCSSINLDGFAHAMRIQADEERMHAMKILDFILERGGKVVLGEIKKPPTSFKSLSDVLEKTLSHEQKVTKLIHTLYEATLKDGDHATKVMLEWFVTEQVEEESSAESILLKVKSVAKDNSAILYLDDEMSKRVAE